MPLSGVSGLNMVCVCWDKDRFGKVCLATELRRIRFSNCSRIIWVNLRFLWTMFFPGVKFRRCALLKCILELDILTVPQTRWFPLRSSRKKAGVSGEIQLTFALVDSSNDAATTGEIYAKWIPWQAIFVQPHSPGSADEDPLSRDLGADGVSDDDDEAESSPSPEEDVSTTSKGPKKDKSKKSKRKKIKSHAYQLNSSSDVVGVIFLEISSITDLPPEKNGRQTVPHKGLGTSIVNWSSHTNWF